MNKLLCLFFLLIVGLTHAQEEPDDGITPPTSPSPITKPKNLSIDAVGITSRAAGKPVPECATFSLSMDEVKEFFREARLVSHGVYWHMLNWSPCYVEGTLTMPNGEKAEWAIQQFRAGSVLLKSGESIHLYCAKCSAKGFPPAK
jgi:hypothetical protein